MFAISPLVMIHVATALLAVVTGTAVLLLKKGSTLHRLLGRSWVVLMAITALVSFGIQSRGHLSWIHGLSLLALVVLVLAVLAIRWGKVQLHLRFMRGAYIGLVVAGLFTLMPNRLPGKLLLSMMA